MTGVLLIGTVVCVVANAVVVAGKVLRADFVTRNVREVGVPERMVLLLAVLEGAGVLGLVLGLAGQEWVGLAGAVGLALFFAVAVAAHLRARVLYSLPFPGFFLLLALMAAAYFRP